MTETQVRDAVPADFDLIVALNLSQVQHTSPMDGDRLQQLHELASYHRVVEVESQFAGFLLVMREGADYDSENYRWFAERYPRFAYIDRIVIGPTFAGKGLGSCLYSDLMAAARRWRSDCLCCEYNLVPPNPVSAAFHRRMGFVEVGQQALANVDKRVSMQVLELAVEQTTPT